MMNLTFIWKPLEMYFIQTMQYLHVFSIIDRLEKKTHIKGPMCNIYIDLSRKYKCLFLVKVTQT